MHRVEVVGSVLEVPLIDTESANRLTFGVEHLRSLTVITILFGYMRRIHIWRLMFVSGEEKVGEEGEEIN